MTTKQWSSTDAERIRVQLAALSSGEQVLLLQQHLQLGQFEQVIAMVEALCSAPTPQRSAGDHCALRLCQALAAFALQDFAQANAVVEAVLAEQPDSLPALALGAQLALRKGQLALGESRLRQIIERYPDYPHAHATLAKLLLPGPSYRDVLAQLQQLLRPKTYLEIGVETGATLALATTAELIVGVDPVLTRLAVPLPPAATLFAETSDEFFNSRSAASVLLGRTLDLAFIDGLHLFEQVLRDFIHVESWANPSTVVLLHDCLPISLVSAARERTSLFWTGDGWKVLEILLRYRPELRIAVIPCAPSGLVLIHGLNPKSQVLSENFAELCASYEALAYPHDPRRWRDVYPLIPNTQDGVARYIAQLAPEKW